MSLKNFRVPNNLASSHPASFAANFPLILLFATSALGLAIPSVANTAGGDDGLDAASIAALQQTQAMLTNPALRNAAIGKDAAAMQANAQTQTTAGTAANTERMYQISSNLMAELVKQTGGDPIKLQLLMQQAQADPQAFAQQHMSAADQAAVHQLSLQVPAAATQTTGQTAGHSSPASSGATISTRLPATQLTR